MKFNTDPTLAVGDRTKIYQSPYSRTDFEDIATIKKILKKESDQWLCEVQFDGEEEAYVRTIYRDESIKVKP